ncbi:hypothetical protein D3C71_2098350 [compost metagenome]
MEKSEPVSTTANPVTQTAEVEVNKASSQEMLSPFDAAGKASNREPIKIRAAKPIRIILEELSVKCFMEKLNTFLENMI